MPPSAPPPTPSTAPSPSAEAGFSAAIADTNARRLRILLPLFLVVHLLHVAVFATRGPQRFALGARTLAWRDGVASVHAITFAFTAVLTGILFLSKRGRTREYIAPATSLLYLLHAAIVVSVDQLTLTGVTPFVGYALGIAVIIVMPPVVAASIYAIGLATFVAGITAVQSDASVRLATLPNGFSICAVSVVLSALLYAARRREFWQSVTIEQQRTALEQLNASLERRVEEQVSEIKARALDIERLNAQLHAQVRERSRELAEAVARLAEQRSGDPSLAPGRILGERFELGEFLGEGGMGSVFEGIDRSTGMRVAIKITRARSIGEIDALQRFVREAATAASVSHPAVVRMIHVDISEDGLLYQVQELIDGETLATRLPVAHTWPPFVVARLGAVLCDGLAAAHAKGVIHRDVKPSNVMVTAISPGLKLVDFGIAKVFADAREAGGSTMTGLILGTPAYMAPEQLDGVRDLTDRADVYAVGVMLFQLLTGRHPADAESGDRSVGPERRVRNPDPRTFGADVPQLLADIVASCLATEPTDRPSASALAAALASFADAHDPRSLDALETAGLLRGAREAASELDETVAGRRGTPN
jgi:hypothetical protein